MESLSELRADFERRTRRSMSMPLAGAIAWTVVAIAGSFLPLRAGNTVLILAVSAIFPLALPIAALRGEQVVSSANPLARLMGACVLMVNLLWPLHILLFLRAPAFVPLSVGIALGLHWIVYSWIVGHALGYRHAIVRTLGLAAAWLLFPQHPVTACATVVVLAYAMTLVEMARRPLAGAAPAPAEPAASRL